MEIRPLTAPLVEIAADWLIVPVVEPVQIDGSLAVLDKALSGALTRLKDLGDLTGKFAATVPLRGISGLGASRLLLIGVGKPEELTMGRLDRALTTAARAISDKKDVRVAVAVPDAAIGARWGRICFELKKLDFHSLRSPLPALPRSTALNPRWTAGKSLAKQSI
jgi:leucyl aminopeptidase